MTSLRDHLEWDGKGRTRQGRTELIRDGVGMVGLPTLSRSERTEVEVKTRCRSRTRSRP